MHEDTSVDRTGPGGACTAVDDPGRSDLVRRTGLGAAADTEMERIAGWVRRALDVPTALVSLVLADRQDLPGAAGLPGPFAAQRSLPLSHSFCHVVVETARPLVVPDAAADPELADTPAVTEVGIVAYAGMPLTDDDGHVLGTLCAVDARARAWTGEELATLGDIARSCAAELRLRLARHDAVTDAARRDHDEEARRRDHDRSRMLLAASQAFTDTSTVHDVRARIGELLGGELRPVHAETVLRDRLGRLHRLPVGAGLTGGEDTDLGEADEGGDVDPTVPRSLTLPVRARTPSATAIREQRVVHYPDRESFAADHPAEVTATVQQLGLHTVVAVPVPGAGVPAGAIVLGWRRPHAVEAADLLTIATIAGYAGQALARARTLEHRTSTAHEMQDAMLTVLPDVDGLAMAARYAPADSRQNVGGDWYDAAPMPDPAGAGPGTGALAVSVGDIIGHDLPAVTIMGQVRSMLRQSAWDHPGGPPSSILSAFEAADHGLALGATGTAVVAHLRRAPSGGWTLRWTNAGHPPPILLHPDGRSEQLDVHDPLFGFTFVLDRPRTDHERELAPGTTLVLYTDGLVERPGSDLDTGIETLLAALGEARGGTPHEIVDAAMHTLPDDPHDDAVAFAVRIGH